MNIFDHANWATRNARKDRNINHDYVLPNKDSYDVYVWGSNTNYTLGTGNQHSKTEAPNLLDFQIEVCF